MPVSPKQALAVGSYILKQKLKGNAKYPLVLMLDPLYRCNLACAGCGKIQHPEDMLKKTMSPEQAWAAAEECAAPLVNIAGGEPLLHSQIQRMAEGFIERGKFLYLCTNALLLKRKLDLFSPSDYLTFAVHLDGLRENHDRSVCRPGTFDSAISAIREAKRRGFRVTTNTTVFVDHPVSELQEFFDQMTELGVDGMMISAGYSYEKAPVQDRFLKVEQTRLFFKKLFRPMREGTKKWDFNHSPFYLDFLEGEVDYSCTPWAMPNYSLFGWQRPCYLFCEDGYAKTFQELMEQTDWSKYGRGRHDKCENCMTHCGYEGTAVQDSLSSPKKIWRSLSSSLRIR